MNEDYQMPFGKYEGERLDEVPAYYLLRIFEMLQGQLKEKE